MSDDLRSSLDRITKELRELNVRLQSESSLDTEALLDLREALDAARLTAWTVHELSKARRGEREADAVLVLSARERARRFTQMAVNLCADLDSGFFKPESEREALLIRIESLRKRLERVKGHSAA